MDSEVPSSLPRKLTAYVWSLLALLFGLALTVIVHWQQLQRQQAEQDFVRNQLANKSYAAVLAQLHSAELLLRAAQTLFLASDEVTPSMADVGPACCTR